MVDWAKEVAKSSQPDQTEKIDWAREITPKQPDKDDLKWKEVFKSAWKNIPRSALETGKEMIEPLKHPIESTKAVGRVVAGGAQKLIPGQQSEEIAEYEQTFDNMVGYFKEKYGSVEGFKKTIAEDPVEVIADVASLMTGTGAAVKGVGIVGKMQKVAKAGEVIQKAGAAIEPVRAVSPALRVTGKGVVKALSKIDGYTPTEIYESAAKFSGKLSRDERRALAQSALDRKIPASVGGLLKAEAQIRKYRNKVDELIEEAMHRGGQIPTSKLLKHFPELRKSEEMQALSMTARRGINRVRREIIDLWRNKKTLTIEEAQTFKQNTYKTIESFYSQTKHSTAMVKAQKVAARAAREELEALIPEIKGANKNWGELIKLQEAMTKVANRVTNRDFMGIGTPIKALAGGTAGGVPGFLGGVALGIIDAPTVKSRIAILLNKMDNQGLLKESSKAAAIRLGLYQAGKSGGAGGEF